MSGGGLTRRAHRPAREPATGSRTPHHRRSGRTRSGAPTRRKTVTIIGAFVQRALNRARHLTPSLGRLVRLIALAGMLAALFSSGLEPPAQASPAAFDPDPTERLQFVIKSVHIYNDRDGWGGGEMVFITNLCSGESNFVCGNGVRAWWDDKFDADSGSTKVMERVSPQNGDQLA